MKIAAIETILLEIPNVHKGPPSTVLGRVSRTLETLLVKVTTEDGMVGWGDAFAYRIGPATRAAIDQVIAPLAVGRDIAGPVPLAEDLRRQLHNLGRNGALSFGLSGLDIALWDIAGKAAGKPIHALLGGACKERVPCYASMLRYGVPDQVGRIAAEAAGRGYRILKLHEITEPAVRAARQAIGPDVKLTVDTNCPWTEREAIAMARAFEPHDLFWLEEPVWPPEDWEALARVGRATGMALAAGENAGTLTDFRHMFAAGAVTFAQPSITKIGGITEMRRVVALAEAHNVAVMPHAPYFGPGLVATLHVIAASRQDMLFERFYVDLEANLWGDAIDPVDGMLAVPHGPGLGLEPDPAVIERYRVR